MIISTTPLKFTLSQKVIDNTWRRCKTLHINLENFMRSDEALVKWRDVLMRVTT